MAIVGEAATSLYGAFRLAHLDAAGMRYFNISREGFWRSFLAAAIVAPFYAFLLILAYPRFDTPPDAVRFASAEAIAYVVAWVAYPLVIAALSERLDRWNRFIGYIVAYNWSAVLQNALFIPVNILLITGVFAAEAGFILWLVVFSAILVYIWFIARTALSLSPMAAAGIVSIDVVLNLMISSVAETMY